MRKLDLQGVKQCSTCKHISALNTWLKDFIWDDFTEEQKEELLQKSTVTIKAECPVCDSWREIELVVEKKKTEIVTFLQLRDSQDIDRDTYKKNFSPDQCGFDAFIEMNKNLIRNYSGELK